MKSLPQDREILIIERGLVTFGCGCGDGTADTANRETPFYSAGKPK